MKLKKLGSDAMHTGTFLYIIILTNKCFFFSHIELIVGVSLSSQYTKFNRILNHLHLPTFPQSYKFVSPKLIEAFLFVKNKTVKVFLIVFGS